MKKSEVVKTQTALEHLVERANLVEHAQGVALNRDAVSYAIPLGRNLDESCANTLLGERYSGHRSRDATADHKNILNRHGNTLLCVNPVHLSRYALNPVQERQCA